MTAPRPVELDPVDGPLVTIGVPCFNSERFVEAAVRSLMTQDHGAIEILVADNASTDSTLDIVGRLAEEDPRIRILTSEHNRGASWNFNRLVTAASGTHFAWTASDDLRPPDFVSASLEALAARPDAVLCSSRTVDIDEDGTELHVYPRLAESLGDDPVVRFAESVFGHLECFPVFGLMPMAALRRTQGIGSFSSSDRVLLSELALLGPSVLVARPLLERRQHAGRSMRLLPKERDRHAWFEPEGANRVAFPRWRILERYLDMVRRAELGAVERIRCLGVVARWGWDFKKLLAGDAYYGARARLRSLRARRRGAAPVGQPA